MLTTPNSIDVDVALAALPFESDMIDRAVSVEIEPGVSLRVCVAEDLFVLKAFADRLQDRADLLGIARRRGKDLDWDAIGARLAPLAEAKDDPAILKNVAALRREFGGVTGG